jgi:hypothetical protein
VSGKVPGEAEKWDDVIRKITSVWTPEVAAEVLAAITKLDLRADASTGDVPTYDGSKYVPEALSFIRTSVTLTAAQVRAIGDVPITLVAGVAGEAHPLVSWGSTYRAGNQPFSNGANVVVGVGPVVNGWYENSFNHAAAASVLQATDNTFRARGMAFNDSYGSDIPLAQLEGQPICYLLEPSSAPNTPFSGGNGTLMLWVVYALIPTA